MTKRACSGGFKLLIARDEEAVDCIHQELEDDPPNEQARFFDVAIDNQGLAGLYFETTFVKPG